VYRLRFTRSLLLAGILIAASLLNLHGKDTVESIVTQMVDARMLRSAELQEWEEEKRKIGDLIYLYNEELGRINDQLETFRLQQDKQHTTTEICRTEIADYEFRLVRVQQLLDQWEPAVAQLVVLVPPPVRKEIFQDLDLAAGKEDPSSLVNRTTRLCMTMQKLNEFHNRITYVRDLHDSPDGRQIEVEVLFAGFGCAWFANEAASIAGYGVPVGDHWQWETDPKLLPQILKAIAIVNSDEPAAWTELPVALNSTQP
jgi:hypothetical protein